MAKYVLKNSKHVMNGKEYVPGDIIETDVPLDRVFINKFELMQDAEDVPASNGTDLPNRPKVKTVTPPKTAPDDLTIDPASGSKKKTKGKGKTEDTSSKSLTGTDVSDLFAIAKDQDYKVYKRTRKSGKGFIYDVFDGDNMQAVKKGLAKKNVDPTIRAHLAEADLKGTD